MKKYVIHIPVLLLLCFLMAESNCAQAQSLRINEFSQGVNGNKEWVELVVTSGGAPVGANNCGVFRLDISGWVLDDNDGSFSPQNYYLGSGIAQGHIRFKNTAPWNALPVGAIIVIYNAADRDSVINANWPADDITDANKDCVYIVPSTSTTLEFCGTYPNAFSCDSLQDYSWVTPSCYVNGSAATWSNMVFANAGDAVTLRSPTYQLIQGLVYGKTGTNCGSSIPMVGISGIAPYIYNNAMGGLSAYYNGTTVNGYFDSANWVVQAASLATPGFMNPGNNTNFITDSIRGGCTCQTLLDLDVEEWYAVGRNLNSHLYFRFRNGVLPNKVVILKSYNGTEFTAWKTLTGNQLTIENDILDREIRSRNYYQLRLYAANGSYKETRVVATHFENQQKPLYTVLNNPSGKIVHLKKDSDYTGPLTIRAYAADGRMITHFHTTVSGNQYIEFSLPENTGTGLIHLQVIENKEIKTAASLRVLIR